MTTTEFSAQFDVLYNNIMSNQAPGLDEYEKSVFLTKAQDEILKNYFNPKGNKYQEGFDDNQKRQIDFSMVLNTITCSSVSSPVSRIDSRSLAFEFPSNALVVLNESFTETVDNKTKYFVVIPIAYSEYTRLMSKPYKLPIKSQAWRLLEGTHSAPTAIPAVYYTQEEIDTAKAIISADDYNIGDDTTAELIATKTTSDIKIPAYTTTSILTSELIGNFNKNATKKYVVRYVRRPNPIILVDLEDSYSNVTINGLNSVTECELDPILHEEILQRAVELAKAAYAGDVTTATTMGQRSE